MDGALLSHLETFVRELETRNFETSRQLGIIFSPISISIIKKPFYPIHS